MNRKSTLFTTIITLILISFLISLSSCSTKRKAKGREDLIFVVADSTEYLELEPVLEQVFGKVIYTPQAENLFKLTNKSVNYLEHLTRAKNVIVAAPLNSGSRTSKYIHSLLDSSVTDEVRNDSAFVFNKYDLWSKNQLVMVLTSPTMEQLKKNILKEHENLLYYFQNASDERLMKMLYHPKYEQKKVEAQFLKDYGFIFYVNSDFLLTKNIEEDNFIWLRRAPNSDRERWIFIHWIENASTALLERDSIINLRNELTKKFYKGTEESTYVEIVDDYLSVEEIDYKGRYALMMNGLWRMNDKSMGGPFTSYTFYDKKTDRIYMIDGSLYAPKYYKRNMLQQVDILLRSWKPEYELNKERKEDLLSELE